MYTYEALVEVDFNIKDYGQKQSTQKFTSPTDSEEKQ